MSTGPEAPGAAAAPPPRRARRRAVGPPGAAVAHDVPSTWSPEPQVPEGDDDRLLHDVPPHHGT